jgi:hypothetical protein
VTADGSVTAEVEKAVLGSVWPMRLVEFTRWVGAGRKLTQTGRLTLADARMLVQRLGTGDVVDPLIGDQMFRTKSSEELTELSAVVGWARAVGLVRRQGNRLVAVKKHATLLDRPLALWERMFEVVGELGPFVCPSGWAMSLLHDNFEAGLGLLLAAMDVDPARVDVQEVVEQVWASVTPLYRMDGLTEVQLGTWRRGLTRDVWRMVELLAELGVVSTDLDRPVEERRSGPVSLTELGCWVMRRRRGDPAPGDPVLQVRVELVDSRFPLVWRRVLVPLSWDLGRLHDVVQVVMGWDGGHLHVFSVDGTRYGPAGGELGFRAEDRVVLGEVARVGDAMAYKYDFGDGWEHVLVVEAATVAEPTARYPRCVAGAGACPPEDCGGIPGYENLRGILADPSDPEHEDMLEWLGIGSAAEFDPARFDLDAVNLRLAAEVRPARPA